MFSQLTFLQANMLWLSLFSSLLIIVYLRRKNVKLEKYSSLFLLKKLPKQILPKKKFKPPLRFFLEFLALLALSLAAAKPLYYEKSTKMALILDNTLSMEAVDKFQESRFEKAKKEIKKIIQEKADAYQIDIYSSAPSLKLVNQGHSQFQEAILALEQVKISLSKDRLGEEFSEIINKENYAEVVVVSDRNISLEDETLNSLLQASKQPKRKINIIPIKDTTNNIFISDFVLGKINMENHSQEVIAKLGYSGVKTAPVEVSLYRYSMGAKAELIARENIALEVEQVKTQSFNVPIEKSNIYQLTVKSISTELQDSIPSDNIAWVSAESKGSEVLFISSEEKPISGLENISYLKIKGTAFADFLKLDSKSLEQYKLLIFKNVIPEKFPKTSALFVVPPKENKFFPIIDYTENAKITSWFSQHQITSYLKVPLISPTKTAIFSTPSWLKSIINTEQGTILVAGEDQGLRFAATGFEIFPFEGTSTPAISILTLNLINWLSNTEEFSSYYLTSSFCPIKEDSLVFFPNGNKKGFLKDQLGFTLDQAGVYQIQKIESQTSAVTKQMLVVNTFYPEESKTAEIEKLELRNSTLELKKNTYAREILQYLIYFALLLLFIDLVLKFFKKYD